MLANRFILAAAACVALFSCGASACATDEDCSLTGVCKPDSGMCACDPGWIGADCGVLDLAPAKYNTGYNYTSQRTSSWGGKTIRDPKNASLFHLFAAEFTGHCGLDYWSPMSRIIRAVGSSPAGPFTFAAEVVGTFAHNPTVIWSPADQLYLMYHIGCKVAQPTSCVQPSFSCDSGNNINGESSISMLSSPDLITWTPLGVALGPNPNHDAWDTDTTNPSAFPMASTSDPSAPGILLAYRGCPYNCGGAELIALASAPSYRGPYTRIGTAQPLFSNGNEDPHVWRDARGHWHMLMHSLEAGGGFGGGPKVGRHAFSRDIGQAWTFNNNTLAYNTTVRFDDGSSIDFFRRERPQLYFSEDGAMTPLYLTTGVQGKGRSDAYTVVQPLATARAWERDNGVRS